MSLWTAALLSQLITLSGGDRTELRARIQSGQEPSYSAETRANVQLTGTDYRSGWTLRYGPSVTSLFLGTPQQRTMLFHAGRADFHYRWRFTTVLVSQDFSYGRQNYYSLTLLPTAGAPSTPPDQSVPSTPTSPLGPVVQQSQERYTLVQIGSSSSGLAIQHTLSRRTTMGASFLYLVSGGLDAPSRETVPLMYGPTGAVNVAYRLTPVDELSSLASVTISDSSRHVRSRVFVGEERWEHNFSPVVSGRVSGGMAVIADLGVRPVALVGLSLSDGLEGGRMTLTTSVEARPIIDPRTARVDNRLSSRAECRWVRERWTATGAIATTQSVDWNGPRSLATYGWTLGTGYGFTREWLAEGGFGSTAMFFEGDPQPMLWSVFVALRFESTFARF